MRYAFRSTFDGLGRVAINALVLHAANTPRQNGIRSTKHAENRDCLVRKTREMLLQMTRFHCVDPRSALDNVMADTAVRRAFAEGGGGDGTSEVSA